MAENKEKSPENTPTCMQSVNRIVKLPVVESSIQTATSVYGKVKDMNEYAKWGLETMESTFHNVVETGKPYAIPVVQKLEQPIKKVDSVLCSGLDYVEAKVPAMKLPPGELYTSTKEYVNDNVTPRVDAAYKSVQGVVDPALQAARKMTDPAVNLAKPTVEAAYKIVEPVVQPAVEKAKEFLHYHNNESKNEEKQLVLYTTNNMPSRSMMSLLSSWRIALFNFNLYSDDDFPYIHFIFDFQFMMIENYEL